MFFNYKNCKVNLSGVDILAANASLDVQSSTEPNYLVDRRFSYNFVPTDNVVTSISVSYYLTGKDLIKPFINNEKGVLTGNIGGLVFHSGYLSSYSINASPNQPALAEIQILVFDQVTGTFSPATSVPRDIPVLNCSDITINESGVGNADNIVSASYSFKNEIRPYYSINTGEGLLNLTPERIIFGKKQISTKVELDNLSGNLSIFGDRAALKLNLRDRNGGEIKETYIASGVVEGRNISIEQDSFTRGSLVIKQEAPGEIPIITGFSPYSGGAGDTVRISGSGFNVFPEVHLNGLYVGLVEYVSDEIIDFVVPKNPTTGPISLYVGGLYSFSATDFIVGDSLIEVSGFTPTSGRLGSRVLISGLNFDLANEIYVGDAFVNSLTFINKSTAEITVPNSAQWDYIKVKSSYLNTSGTSSSKFLPFPEIQAVIPLTAAPGGTVNISGLALSGVTGIYFANGITGVVQGITNIKSIPVALPTGNTTGPITGVGGLGIYSVFTGFITYAKITDVVPSSGKAGTSVVIKGNDFYYSNLKSTGSGIVDPLGQFLVDFNGGSTGFYIQDSQTLTGMVPYNGRSGIISIIRVDGSTHVSTGKFNVLKSGPLITAISPSTGLPAVRGNRGEIITISGRNLLNITGLYVIPTGSLTVTNLLSPANVYSSQISDDVFQFSIPSGVSGVSSVKLETDAGVATGSGILFVKARPIFSGFTPLNGSRGETIFLSGYEFYSGTTKLYFSGDVASGRKISAQITHIALNEITGVIPGLSSSVKYKVVVDNGVDYAVSTDLFEYIGAPTISGFAPLSGETDSTVIISGKNLKSLTSLKHGQVPITGLSYLNTAYTGISIKVPNLTGYLSQNSLFKNNIGFFNLANSFGESASTGVFETIPPAMVFSGFKPTLQIRGNTIVISGLNIFQTTGVGFSGLNGLSIVSCENRSLAKFAPTIGYPKTGITVRVPSDAVSGPIKLIGTYGSETSAESLTINANNQVGTFTPSRGIYGDSVRLSGDSLHESRFYLNGLKSGGIDNTTPFIYEPPTADFPDGLVKFNGTLNGAKLSGLSTEYSIVGSAKVVDILIPHPISRTSPIYSTNRDNQNPAEHQFVPSSSPFISLPIISGISHTGIRIGDTLYVSGLNASNLNINCLGITGNSAMHGIDGNKRIEFVSKYNTSNKEIEGNEQSFFGLGEFFYPPEPTMEFATGKLESYLYNYPIYKNLIGSHVTDASTGFYVIPVQIGPNFLGTGKVFLFFDEPEIYPILGSPRTLGEYTLSGQTLPTNYKDTGSPWYNAFTGSHTASRLSKLLFTGWDLVIMPELIQLSGFSPTSSGYAGNTAHLLGTGMGNVNTVNFVDDSSNHYALTAPSISSNDIAFIVPTITPKSGRVFVSSESSSGITSQYFTISKPPAITGFSPTKGLEGGLISIFGINLQNVDTIKLKSQLNNQIYNFVTFGTSGPDGLGNTIITGLVPLDITPVPQNFNIQVSSYVAGGNELGTFVAQINNFEIFGNLTVGKHTILGSGASATGSVEIKGTGQFYVNGIPVAQTTVVTGSGVTSVEIIGANNTLNQYGPGLTGSSINIYNFPPPGFEELGAGNTQINSINSGSGTLSVTNYITIDSYIVGAAGIIESNFYTGNGLKTGFSLKSTCADEEYLVVSLGGIVLVPNRDYFLSGNESGIGIIAAPNSGEHLEIRHLLLGGEEDQGSISVSGTTNNIYSAVTNIVSTSARPLLADIRVSNSSVYITGSTNFITGDANITGGVNTITGNRASITGGINTITGSNGTFYISGGINTIQSGILVEITGGTTTIYNTNSVSYATGLVTIYSGTNFVTGNANITDGVNTVTGSNGTFYISGGINTIQSGILVEITGGTTTIQSVISVGITGGINYITGTVSITGGQNNIVPNITGDIQITGRLGVTGIIDLSGIFQYTYTSSIPSDTADVIGVAGQFAVDDSYLYFKATDGWKRSAWSTF